MQKNAMMQAGTSLRGSAVLPNCSFTVAGHHFKRSARKSGTADRPLHSTLSRQHVSLSPLQLSRYCRLRQKCCSHSRLSPQPCCSSGAASVQPPSSWTAPPDSSRCPSEIERRILHRRVTGTICVVLALGCACSCLTNGPAPAAFASLALTGSKVTEEGIRASVRSAWAGLGAGFLHTLSGPDHLAALTPLTIGRSSFKATLLGALWGFGHSIGQLILGLLMVVLKDRFTSLVPALSKYGSVTVGLTLLVIGIGGLYETWTESSQLADEQQPALAGAGGPVIEAQAGQSVSSSSSGVPADVNNVRTLFTGIVFGLQPDALFVIVPALALPTKLAAMAYIFMFVFGTVAAMGSYTAFIGATSNAMQKNYSGLCTKLSSIASVVAIGIGSAVLAAGFGVRLPFL